MDVAALFLASYFAIGPVVITAITLKTESRQNLIASTASFYFWLAMAILVLIWPGVLVAYIKWWRDKCGECTSAPR